MFVQDFKNLSPCDLCLKGVFLLLRKVSIFVAVYWNVKLLLPRYSLISASELLTTLLKDNTTESESSKGPLFLKMEVNFIYDIFMWHHSHSVLPLSLKWGQGRGRCFLPPCLKRRRGTKMGGHFHYFGGGTDISMIKKYRFAKINYCENKVN